MENSSTHFIFDGDKVVISPDLHSVVSFLQEIEKEFERRYFLDACSRLAEHSECTELILPNEEGRFTESFKRTVKHIL